MEIFKFTGRANILKLPRTAGIYALCSKRKILYIGKAANLKERVKNHFLQSTYRDNLFIGQVSKIGYIETGSEIEALLLESKLIKQNQPKYNVLWKDDKNYFYIELTKDPLPRILITHQTSEKRSRYIGPFVDGGALRQVLKLLRRAFPYYTAKKHSDKLCLWCHLKLCPGPNPDKKDYEKNIKNLTAFLKGERQSVFKNLKGEMAQASKEQNYERAANLRDQISSLENIILHAKIFRHISDKEIYQKTSRIEAYDVSNIQGKEATGSMVVFLNARPEKNQYRKFKIRLPSKPNDTAMIREVLTRRFRHPEWPLPESILIDGGMGQFNTALKCKNLNGKTKNIKIMSLAKKQNNLYVEGKKPMPLESLPREFSNLILHLRDEAHRFAISYHKKLREKKFMRKP